MLSSTFPPWPFGKFPRNSGGNFGPVQTAPRLVKKESESDIEIEIDLLFFCVQAFVLFQGPSLVVVLKSSKLKLKTKRVTEKHIESCHTFPWRWYSAWMIYLLKPHKKDSREISLIWNGGSLSDVAFIESGGKFILYPCYTYIILHISYHMLSTSVIFYQFLSCFAKNM